MNKFFRDDGGVSGVEFAFILPFLALVLGGIISAWSYNLQASNMRDSVEVGGKYYIQGGTDDAKALSIVDAAWKEKPKDGKITVDRTCICAGAAASCSGVCGDGSVPEIHLTIVATSNWTNPMLPNPMFMKDPLFPNGLELYQREAIRVR